MANHATPSPDATPSPAERLRRANAPQPRIQVIPLTLPKANALVAALHRHHAPIPGGFGWFCVGAVADGQLVGCAIAGRPTNRNNDDGQTVEVLRVATDGTENAPSALLGACAKASRAIGARRIITYTLDSESGSSLKGAGWRREADGIESWWTHPGKDGKGRVPAVDRPHMAERKARWGVTFREAVSYTWDAPTSSEPAEMALFDLTSVDEETPNGVPRESLPVVHNKPRTGDFPDNSVPAVNGDVPARANGEPERRIGFTPVHVHTPNTTQDGAA